ncbi:hypothetical protein CPAV1605_771 [seawater metagenome]|uniref:Uncharacterized protein n=1 Tax=seawater metagenome TaxID=1561972 RepID=A0A5E8CIW1_9ZZZZ
MYMEEFVQSTRTALFESLNNLFDTLEEHSKELDIKSKKIIELEAEVEKKTAELDTYNKVSFIGNLTKQITQRNETIEVLNKRIKALQKSKSESNDVPEPVIDDEDEEDNVWLIRELDNKKYLVNTESKKVHVLLQNETPGNIVGRITSKDKFKKYSEPKEYCN